MVVGAVVCGAFTGRLKDVTLAVTESASSAVMLAIGLVGVMALFLGLMQAVRDAGLLRDLARLIRPVMRRLFPDVPADHPAMSMMVLNMAANMLGLGNVATPFGLKAMTELDKLNPRPGVATNAMVLFLAINTSGVAVLPTGMIGMRASLGSTEPGSILLTTLIATATSTTIAIISALLLARFWPVPQGIVVTHEAPQATIETPDALAVAALPELEPWKRALLWCAVLLVFVGFGTAFWQTAQGDGGVDAARHAVFAEWPLLGVVVGLALFAALRGVKVYDAVVVGAKEGFEVAFRIIPYLVAILVAVGMLRASGAIDLMVAALSPLTSLIGMPSEVLPMVFLRPLSGSGSFAVAGEIMKAHGPDSIIGQIVSTMQGSTETTFYVLALYLGSVQVRAARHAVLVCLLADATGMIMSVLACRWLL